MKKALFIGALLITSNLTGQEANMQPQNMPTEQTSTATETVVLMANTEVVVTPNDTLTTKGKTYKEGSKFRLSTVFDVMQDGVIVIPKGTMGEGTITYITNKGAFGKSGKMEVSFNSLQLGGKTVTLTGTHRQEGEGNTGATVGAVVLVGPFAAFVTGKSASIPNGAQLRARTGEALTFNVPAGTKRIASGTLTSSVTAAPAPAPAPATPVEPK